MLVDSISSKSRKVRQNRLSGNCRSKTSESSGLPGDAATVGGRTAGPRAAELLGGRRDDEGLCVVGPLRDDLVSLESWKPDGRVSWVGPEAPG
jgi:hypothetical protein